MIDLSVRRQERLTFKANVKQGRHGWIRLTPAYSVHLVEDLVKRGGKNQLVLDPFCGTGTTPLVCSQAGIPCHGVDINPFMVWMASLKCSSFSEVQASTLRELARESVCRSATEAREAWVPPLNDITKWWDAPVLGSLARLFAAIQRHEGRVEGDVYSLALIAFCRTIINTANVSFGHQSMSFRQANSNVADVELFSRDIDNEVNGSFVKAVDRVAENCRDKIAAPAKVYLGDSRHLAGVLGNKRKYTTLVTSPPYPNRMSYIRELRPYMFWLGYLSDGRAAGELDWKAIGGTWGCATGYLTSWQSNPDVKVPHPGFDQTVKSITEKSRLLGPYVRKYFEDAVGHVRGLKDVLAPGAKAYYVVGNSKFYDVMLDVEEIYASMFRDAGFSDVHIVRMRKRTSKKELFEFVVEAIAP